MGAGAALAVGLWLAASPAAPDDWYQVLWPLPGVELSPDDRVLALFAALNACGLDEGPVARALPVPRYEYGPLRRAVRERVHGGEAAPLRSDLEAYLDAHPLPVESYLAAALATERGGELKRLPDLLDQAWAGWRLAELVGEAGAGEQRAALLAWVPHVQGPLQRGLKLLQLGAQPLRLVSNPLDAPGAVRPVGRLDGRLVLALGPPEDDGGAALVRAVARVALAPLVGRYIGGWTRGPMVLREARMDGATEATPAELATSLLAEAVAARATGGGAAAALAAPLERSPSLEAWVAASVPRLAWTPPGSP